MSDVFSLIFGLIFGVLGSIGGFVWLKEFWIKHSRDKAFAKLFPKAGIGKVIIVCPTQPASGESLNIPTTYEDSLAQAEIQVQLSRRDIHHEVKLHSQITTADLSQTLFLICGPVANGITRKLFHSVKFPFSFVNFGDGYQIADRDERPQYSRPNDSAQDFAILGVVENPWARPEKPTRVFVVAGIGGLGTWGAAYHFASRTEDLFRKLEAERVHGKAPWFAAVLRATRDENRPPVTKILEVERFSAR